MLTALVFIIGVMFLTALVLMLLLALCVQILARWLALTTRSKMLLAATILTLLGVFTALFPTVALGAFFIVLILAAGSVMPYAIASDARGRAKRKALIGPPIPASYNS